jgi:DNA polymerase III epsilon subunit-like protein
LGCSGCEGQMTFGSRAGDGAKFLVVDVETTGLDPRRDDIVEIAVVRCIPGSGYQPHISALVKPKCPIGAGASEVHGIYDHDVEFEESFEDVAPSIFDFMGGLPICGWNVKFDVSFLNRYKHLYRPEDLISALIFANIVRNFCRACRITKCKRWQSILD